MSSAGNRCPGITWWHEAEDGGLARVRAPGGRIGAAGLDALARGAALGNGILEITSRASVQIRGLHPGVAGDLQSLLESGGLLRSAAHDRVRNIVASPLAGRGPRAVAMIDELVGRLDEALCADAALAGLPERFLITVDDGTGDVVGRPAGVSILATAPDRFTVSSGDASAAGLDALAALAAALAAARAAAVVNGDAGGAAGGRSPDVAGAIGTDRSPGPSGLPTHPLPAPGRIPQRDGRIAVTALARLGRPAPRGLAALARLGLEARLSPARTITVLDLDPAEAPQVEAALRGAGLVLEAGSGWVGITACAGLGACPRARIDVRAVATRRAAVRRAADPPEHWAACERACGRPPGVRASVPLDDAATALAPC